MHEPRDFAEMRILSMLVEKGELVQIPVDPSLVDTTNDVKSLHRSKRNCIFEDEVCIILDQLFDSIRKFGLKTRHTIFEIWTEPCLRLRDLFEV